ncbi:MAG: DUF4197 domain-containing protein [Bacteroidota bacterium]
MKKLLFLSAVSLLTVALHAQPTWTKIKEKASQGYNPNPAATNGLTNDEIIKGLREALNIGVKNSSARASVVDGFYKNPLIFIPFPPEAEKVAKKLRELGMGKKVDEFTLTLNRAAEEAAKEAAPIFLSAVQGITIQDGLGILKGNEIAATTYLKGKTQTQLTQKFSPVVQRALQKTYATKYWTEIVNIYNRIPTVKKVNPDLNAYATGKAIDGLFFLVGDEETKIRKDPAARVTDILRRVFGSK